MTCRTCKSDSQPMASPHQCRACKNAATKAYRERRKAEGRPYKTRQRQTARQRMAQRMVSTALNRGLLSPPVACCKCGNGPAPFRRLDAHHRDYLKPLEVIWVCRPCHIKIHDLPGACINSDGPADPSIYSLPRPVRPSYEPVRDQWNARIYRGGKHQFLGRYRSELEAQAAINAILADAPVAARKGVRA